MPKIVKPHTWREFEDELAAPPIALRNASLERRPDAISSDYLTSFTYGPQEQGDPNGDGGVLNRLWKIRVGNDHKIWIAKTNNSFTGS